MVVGEFTLKNNLIKDIHVNLFLNEKCIDSLIVSGNQDFGFYLQRNLIYTIEIKKEGFVRRTLGVSTEMPDNAKHKPYFNFLIQMPLTRLPEDSEENKYVKYVYDLPGGFIYFNPEIKKFDFTKNYSDELKIKLLKTKKEANKEKNASRLDAIIK